MAFIFPPSLRTRTDLKIGDQKKLKQFAARKQYQELNQSPFQNGFNRMVQPLIKSPLADNVPDPNGPPTLSTLPPELVERIVQVADPKSLIALRLTCRSLANYALIPFCQSHFTERKHTFSTYSLQALIDITAHPLFGTFVRSIRIGSSRLESIVGYTCGLEVIKDQTHLSKANSGAILLKTALNNINDHGHSVSIGVWDDIASPGWGAKQAYARGIGIGVNTKKPPLQDLPWETLSIILAAMDMTACSVSAIHVSWDPRRITSRTFTHPFFTEQMDGMKRLYLTPCRVKDSFSKLDTVRCIRQMVAHSPNLQDLTLQDLFTVPILPGLEELAYGPFLKRFSLSKYSTESEDLIDFLESISSTLKDLTLSCISFLDRDALVPFLTSLKDGLRLSKLALSSITGVNLVTSWHELATLRNMSVKQNFVFLNNSTSITYEGSQQIQDGLSAHLAYLPRMSPDADQDANYWG